MAVAYRESLPGTPTPIPAPPSRLAEYNALPVRTVAVSF